MGQQKPNVTIQKGAHRPPFSSCRTPSSKRELAGSRGYATINSSGQAPEYFSPGEPLDIGAAPSLPEDVAAQTAVIPGLAAECACLGEAASGTPEAWPSTDSEVEGASSGGSCEGLVTAGDLPRCQSTAHGHSSCSAGSAVLGSNDTVASESGTLEDGRENTADVTAFQSGADCASEAALQGSEQEADRSKMQICQAAAHVQQVVRAEASDHQHLEAAAQPTLQSAATAGTGAEPNSEGVKCSTHAEPAPESAGASEEPELIAAAASGDGCAGGSPGCESSATCAIVPAWAWATKHTAPPAAASAHPQQGHSGAHSAPPQVAQPGHRPAGHFLQAALQRLPPSHALPACGLDSVDDEECQVLQLAPSSLAILGCIDNGSTREIFGRQTLPMRSAKETGLWDASGGTLVLSPS